MAKPFREGAGWAVRVLVNGKREYLSGYDSYAKAKDAHDQRLVDLKKGDKEARLGPQKTSVAQALSDYAFEAMPHHKGATQEVRRINRYLRAVGLPVLQLAPYKSQAPVKEAMRQRKAVERQVHWVVSKVVEGERAIPSSLRGHRAALEAESAQSEALRKALARTAIEDVTRHQVQTLVCTLEAEGFGMSTVRLEVAILRQLFGHAKNMWNWARPVHNPASGVKIQTQNNSRDRILTEEEWAKIAPALAGSENKYVFPLVCLMLESAMRSCEPLLLLRWEHVIWERRILALPDGKSGKRNVPLGPGAMAILHYIKGLGSGCAAHEPVFPTTYEAVKKIWRTAREAAGISDIQLHDLRHTSATRYSCEFDGDVMKLKIVTGHKTLEMVARYVNLTAEHVATMMHGEELPDRLAPAGLNTDVMQVVQEAQVKATVRKDAIRARVAKEQSLRRREQVARKAGLPWPPVDEAAAVVGRQGYVQSTKPSDNVVHYNFRRAA